MILHECTETRHGKIHTWIAKRLPKLIRVSREEVSKRAKEIYTGEAVRHVGPQANAIHSSAGLPKVFAAGARIRIAGLIMILAPLAGSCIGPPERNQSSDVNLGAESLIRAQDCVTRGGLKAQIANSL